MSYLSDAEQKDLSDLPLEHENSWFKRILKRFRLSPTAASFRLSGSTHGHNVCATARNIIRDAQAVGTHDKDRQLLQIWKYLKDNYPYHVCRMPRPSKDTSLSDFMRKLYVADQGVVFGSEPGFDHTQEISDEISDDYKFDDSRDFDDSDWDSEEGEGL
ncbi:hypothetical protein N7493_001745 [Penicillium malachiteum]|uniref:Uncharacterized protein n=1 Tax=Penicillium malachiteum TaxID=1324776 RepID=A0AAD6HVS0_9EURO|nr:hypothetical protein N7493_001745 [Penicillium malachiteum]